MEVSSTSQAEEERERVRALLCAHEELLAAARGFAVTLAEERRGGALEPDALDELEEAAGRLDEAAGDYGRARAAYGPCEWEVSDVIGAGLASDRARDLAERSEALYAAAEAVAELAASALPPQAVDAARAVLSRAAVAYYEASRAVVAYQTTLCKR